MILFYHGIKELLRVNVMISYHGFFCVWKGGIIVPTLYLNNGLRIYINNREKEHNSPHVHVLYRDENYSFAFDGEQLAGGKLPRKQLKEAFYIKSQE